MINIEKHWKTMKHSKNTVKETMKIRQIIIKNNENICLKQWTSNEKHWKITEKHNNIEKYRKHENHWKSNYK
jgi:hypothetical protein